MVVTKFIRKIIKQHELLSFYANYVNKDELCFDIGANKGECTDTLLKIGAKVVAIEPQNNCYNKLISKYKKK